MMEISKSFWLKILPSVVQTRQVGTSHVTHKNWFSIIDVKLGMMDLKAVLNIAQDLWSQLHLYIFNILHTFGYENNWGFII